MLPPSQSKIDWIQTQWPHLPPHVQETITLLIDQCAAVPVDGTDDDVDAHQRFTGAPRTRLYSLSRWLLKILRHTPEAAGLSMDANGWIQIDQIIRTLPDYLAGFALLPVNYLINTIEHILWQRVQFAGDSVRATYGHTSQQFDPSETQIPDAPLFHGTAWERWPLIQHTGLTPAGRRFVQLNEAASWIAGQQASLQAGHEAAVGLATEDSSYQAN